MIDRRDPKQALHRSCREKRRRALQRCNLTSDIPVDGAPMVLPVPDEPWFFGGSFPRDRSIGHLDAPQKIEVSEGTDWVEITDAAHPLFGQRFAVISLSLNSSRQQSVLLHRPGSGTVRVLRRMTSLSVLVDHTPRAKLSAVAAQEFLNLVMEYEVWSPTKPIRSGAQSTKSRDKTLPNSSNK